MQRTTLASGKSEFHPARAIPIVQTRKGAAQNVTFIRGDTPRRLPVLKYQNRQIARPISPWKNTDIFFRARFSFFRACQIWQLQNATATRSPRRRRLDRSLMANAQLAERRPP
ncbi:hypothetical protein, partial [Pseudomonas aeruginosa]|uniref:hypothetical protein n=1 Tax=Pseudomonas aeruginosa TaxID=287 RepID=UPI001ABC44CA